VTMAA